MLILCEKQTWPLYAREEDSGRTRRRVTSALYRDLLQKVKRAVNIIYLRLACRELVTPLREKLIIRAIICQTLKINHREHSQIP